MKHFFTISLIPSSTHRQMVQSDHPPGFLDPIRNWTFPGPIGKTAYLQTPLDSGKRRIHLRRIIEENPNPNPNPRPNPNRKMEVIKMNLLQISTTLTSIPTYLLPQVCNFTVLLPLFHVIVPI